MKKPIDKDRLQHILDAIAKVERYIQDVDAARFIANEEKVDAVVRNVEIVGEAVSTLSRELKAAHPNVEWRFASAMRNRLIHGYFEVDPQIVWSTIKNDIPKFKNEIIKIIEELGN